MKIKHDKKIKYIQVFSKSAVYIERETIDENIKNDMEMYLKMIISDMDFTEQELSDINKMYKLLIIFNEKADTDFI